MTIMIGIHQHQEKVDKLYENMGLHAAPLTAVGPFPTKGEALTWQQDISKKNWGLSNHRASRPRRKPDSMVWFFL